MTLRSIQWNGWRENKLLWIVVQTGMLHIHTTDDNRKHNPSSDAVNEVANHCIKYRFHPIFGN